MSIPFARNSSHFVHIHNNLVAVLTEVRDVQNLSAKVLWVSCRLNRSNQQDSPVFVGWVEDSDAINTRVRRRHPFAPVELRFGDTHPSQLYSECLRAPLGHVVPRCWRTDRADATSQRLGESFYDESHRRSVPIKVKELYVGTLNVAFSGDPDAARDDIKKILIRWAQAEDSPLVMYIRDSLDYSGPRHPKP